MTEDEVMDMDDYEVFEELKGQYGEDALKEVGSYTQQFEIALEHRGKTRDYVTYLKSLADLPDAFNKWDEEDAWKLMTTDMRIRARAALLASDIIM